MDKFLLNSSKKKTNVDEDNIDKPKFKKKFISGWLQLDEFKHWLKKGKNDEEAYCLLCSTVVTAHKSDLTKHGKTAKHLSNERKIQKTSTLPEIYKKATSEDLQIRRAEIQLSGLLATNDLPFLLMDSLTPLLANIFPDSNIAKKLAVKRTTSTSIIKNVLGPHYSSYLSNQVKDMGSYFSLIMDETTDLSSVKQCAFTIISYDVNKIRTSFFDIKEYALSTAEDLFKCLKETLSEKGIPLKNLVGFSSDTPNIMVGVHNSVFSRLKEKLLYIACVKCSCHSIHLAASYACLKLPRSVEDLLRNIGAHFSRSFPRQKKFQEFHEYYKFEKHKILLPAITRWLSVKQCVDRVLEQYIALESYFRLEVFEDPSKTTETILTTMTKFSTKIYLEFMSYTLGLLTDFNTMFQAETPLLHKLKPETEKILLHLCGNFLNIEYIKNVDIFTLNHKNKEEFVNLENIYIGVAATTSLQEAKKNLLLTNIELERLLQNCLNFYIELISQIKKRFDFNDELFNVIGIVNRFEAQSYKIRSLDIFFKRFPFVKVDLQLVDNEWKQHALLNHKNYGLNSSLEAETYWKKVFDLKNAAGMGLFDNLKKVITFCLILPFSKASVERIFSNLRHSKTYTRNKLNTDTLAALLHSKEGIRNDGGIIDFEPSKVVLTSKFYKEKQ